MVQKILVINVPRLFSPVWAVISRVLPEQQDYNRIWRDATGPEGALTLYGRPERPRFDWQRV